MPDSARRGARVSGPCRTDQDADGEQDRNPAERAAANAPARAMEQQGAHACGGNEVARGTVSRIVDGRTFVLDDGREIRLAAIEVPPLSPPSNASDAAGGKASAVALDALAGADQVVLRSAEIASDRRLVAYAYAMRDGEELFVQGELVADGFARVGDRVGRDCAGELLSREKIARKARLGLWADPYYDVLNVETPVDVPAQRGQFALVEGTVTSVRESGATIYVNFGRRRSEDITVTVPKRNERTFAAAGLDLKTLAGRRIRVRGWVEQRGVEDRAWIAAERPEQIENANGE